MIVTCTVGEHLSCSTLLPPARADDSHADLVVIGITFVCVIFLLLITFVMIVGYYLILENNSINKSVSVMSTGT